MNVESRYAIVELELIAEVCHSEIPIILIWPPQLHSDGGSLGSRGHLGSIQHNCHRKPEDSTFEVGCHRIHSEPCGAGESTTLNWTPYSRIRSPTRWRRTNVAAPILLIPSKTLLYSACQLFETLTMSHPRWATPVLGNPQVRSRILPYLFSSLFEDSDDLFHTGTFVII
jgi:hypothetical protein